MKRSMFQVYVKNSVEAVDTYRKAFNVEKVLSYLNDDGTGYIHCEMDVYGQVLAVSEIYEPQQTTGTIMQFCLHFGEGGEEKVMQAHDVLREGAISVERFEADWSPLVYDITDKYGVRWCIFV